MHEPLVHFLLPFALPAATEGAAVLPARRTPALDRLVRHAHRRRDLVGADFQRSLPHERWLADTYGVDAGAQTGDVPFAPYMLLADGVDPGDACWACVEPVHISVAQDHLVLNDPAALALDNGEAEALLAEARISAASVDMTLLAPRATRWYLRGAALGALTGASPARAIGRSIDLWLPHETPAGASAESAALASSKSDKRLSPSAMPPRRSRAWMKLQNEIQMAWHTHPVNTAREARQAPPVNGLWLHAQGVAAAVGQPFAAVFADPIDAAAARGLALAAGAVSAGLPAAFADLPPLARKTPALIEIDSLTSPFIAQDWGRWLDTLAGIDAHWLAPAAQALREGSVGEVRLTLCGDTDSVTLAIRRFDLRTFWRRRTFASLLRD